MDTNNKFIITGTIEKMGDVETFKSGFEKRRIVLNDGNEKFPQLIQFECVRDMVKELDSYKAGDRVTVGFEIRGHEYNGRYYVDLTVRHIRYADGYRPSATPTAAAPAGAMAPSPAPVPAATIPAQTFPAQTIPAQTTPAADFSELPF